MDKEYFCECLKNGHTMKLVDTGSKAIVLYTKGSANHIYYVLHGNMLSVLDMDSFKLKDVTHNENGNAIVLVEYDKEKRSLCVLKSIPTRKLQLLLYTGLGIENGSAVIDVLLQNNMSIENESFLNFEDICTCFSFVVNAPLGKKPTHSEDVIGVMQGNDDLSVFDIQRGDGSVKAYRIEKDTRSKNEKRDDKNSGDKSWTCSGFKCTEL